MTLRSKKMIHVKHDAKVICSILKTTQSHYQLLQYGSHKTGTIHSWHSCSSFFFSDSESRHWCTPSPSRLGLFWKITEVLYPPFKQPFVVIWHQFRTPLHIQRYALVPWATNFWRHCATWTQDHQCLWKWNCSLSGYRRPTDDLFSFLCLLSVTQKSLFLTGCDCEDDTVQSHDLPQVGLNTK